MFGKKKKTPDKRLPDIPPSMRSPPTIEDYQRSNFDHSAITPPSENEDKIHGLPAFPDSPMKKGFSQSAIKDAIETPEKEGFPELPEEKDILSELPTPPSEETKNTEMEEWKPQMPSDPTNHFKRNYPESSSENKPLFVKLEKFKEAKESLDIIMNKVGEMEDLIKMVKEIKEKENREIIEWEKEVEKIKARINSINLDIFENAY